MANFKKKFKSFVNSKGGLITLISVISLVIIALFLIVIGMIYSDYNGDWSKIPAVLGSDDAITIYVISGLVIVLLIYIYVWFHRKEDI